MVLEQGDLIIVDSMIPSVTLCAVHFLSRPFPSAKMSLLLTLQLIRQISDRPYGSSCHHSLLTIFNSNCLFNSFSEQDPSPDGAKVSIPPISDIQSSVLPQ